MHSEVRNCDRRAHLPTPAAPSIATRYESAGPLCPERTSSIGAGFIGLVGGIKLLLLERRRLNESPLLTMPIERRKTKRTLIVIYLRQFH